MLKPEQLKRALAYERVFPNCRDERPQECICQFMTEADAHEWTCPKHGRIVPVARGVVGSKP